MWCFQAPELTCHLLGMLLMHRDEKRHIKRGETGYLGEWGPLNYIFIKSAIKSADGADLL